MSLSSQHISNRLLSFIRLTKLIILFINFFNFIDDTKCGDLVIGFTVGKDAHHPGCEFGEEFFCTSDEKGGIFFY